MRKVAIFTSTRGEYGIYTPVMDAIEKRDDIEFTLIVGCMHLVHEYGYTIKEIEKDGRKIGAKVEMLLNSNTCAAQCKVMGIAAIGVAQALEKIKPDILLVLGDRGEQLSAAIASQYMRIPVAHMHGGERMEGGIDEFIRHALTKFSHIHFPATQKSANRIRKMGEEEWRIYMTGSCGVDSLYNKNLPNREELAEKYGFDPKKKVVLAIHHPVTTEFNLALKHIEETVKGLARVGYHTICIYSNADAGNKTMMKQLHVILKKENMLEKVKIKKNIPHEDYLGWLKSADLMVSNSSSGVIEAPSAGIPVINVGNRQKGRECSEFVLHVDYNAEQIVKAAEKAFNDKEYIKKVSEKENPYDPFKDGRAGERIAEFLATVELDDNLVDKEFTY